MLAAAPAANETSAARRRQRRLRQFLRHERLIVAMLLAESTHHAAPRGQKQARSGGVGREVNYEAKATGSSAPRSVTWLPRGPSSCLRSWVVATPWTTPPSRSFWRSRCSSVAGDGGRGEEEGGAEVEEEDGGGG